MTYPYPVRGRAGVYINKTKLCQYVMGHAWLIETEGEKIETQPSYKVEHYGFLNLRKRKVKREPICGYNWIQDGCLHYIDEFGDERRIGPDCKPKVTVVRE